MKMAQGEVAVSGALVLDDSPPANTQDELRQILEFEKIITFHDAIVSGTHPRVKIPANLVHLRQAAVAAGDVPSSVSSTPSENAAQAAAASLLRTQGPIISAGQRAQRAHQAHGENGKRGVSLVEPPGLGTLSTASASAGAALSKPDRRPEIDPVLLTKSESLVRAEIQVQRRRAEGALKDQLRHITHRVIQSADPLPDFDLADVMRKAQELVQSTASLLADTNVGADKSDAGLSLDGHNLYSSDFQTPEPNHSRRLPEEEDSEDNEDVQHEESSEYEPVLDEEVPLPPPGLALAGPTAAERPSGTRTRKSVEAQEVAGIASATAAALRGMPSQVGAPARRGPRPHLSGPSSFPGQGISSEESGEASGPGDSGTTDNELNGYYAPRMAGHGAPHGSREDGELQVIRVHDLSPVAPQPAHISPLVRVREPALAISGDTVPRGTPAQVAALRGAPSAATSPESSPHGAKAGEKKRSKKKKKRKADRLAMDSGPSPIIKAEPQSPSPLATPALVRPNKRRKHGYRTTEGFAYDEPRMEFPLDDDYRGNAREVVSVYREERAPVIYERRDSRYAHSSAQPIIIRESAAPYQEIRETRAPPAGARYVQRADSPGSFAAQYETRGTRAVSAMTQGAPSRVPFESQAVSFRPETSRDRSRSPVYRARQASAHQAPRIIEAQRFVVDEFGRKYIEPPRPTQLAPRHSTGATRLDDPEIIYERMAPPRQAASRMSNTVEDNGVIYRRHSPTFVAPRRVVTQPEYVGPEYREYRQREYSARSVAPGADAYAPDRRVSSRAVINEPAREYLPRAHSVRPTESVRYELDHQQGDMAVGGRTEMPPQRYEYHGEHTPQTGFYAEPRRDVGVQSHVQHYDNRPEHHGVQRAYSVHPEAHLQRAYSVRPETQVMQQRAYSVRPAEPPYYRDQ
jgi:hypothetical protein